MIVLESIGIAEVLLKPSSNYMTSSDNGTATIEQTPDGKSNSSLQPIWEYDWKTETVRRTPQKPLTVAWYGIVFAVGCYPIVLSILMFAYWWPATGFSIFPIDPEVIIAVPCCLVIGFSVAMIYGVVMSIPAYLLLRLVNWIFRGPISSRAASGIFGGLTGFFCLTGGGLSFVIAGESLHGDLEELYFLLFTAILAVVVGHLGAVWAGYRNRNRGFPFFDPLVSADQKITIKFLMKITTIVAVVVVICKAIGPAGLYVGVAWLAYLVVQIVLLYCDHLVTLWLGRRRLSSDN